MVGFVGFWGLFFVVIFALHLYMTKIGKDFVFSLKFFVFSAERDRAAFLTRLVVFAERTEPRSLRGWWFLRNGQSRVPYRVRYGRTTVRNIPLGVPRK